MLYSDNIIGTWRSHFGVNWTGPFWTLWRKNFNKNDSFLDFWEIFQDFLKIFKKKTGPSILLYGLGSDKAWKCSDVSKIFWVPQPLHNLCLLVESNFCCFWFSKIAAIWISKKTQNNSFYEKLWSMFLIFWIL